MLNYSTTVKRKSWVNSNVMKLHLIKPSHYKYQIGQASEVTIKTSGHEGKFAQFTITSFPENNNLEFIIKVYLPHHGPNLALSKINQGTKVQIKYALALYEYVGKGTFITGRSRITPFFPLHQDASRKKNNARAHSDI